ncbi:uncharacterized protein LOC111208942 [Brassica napus]|uniref:uncharacterized protein LOC111208942 n=1 Tax=Brassica napus TaxID=3708 RepID=UPI0020795DF9|nr:uncharacterized protein LOC111208942 [Brassica napus]XP_022564331.2 uncharacterized protein LOC111208942 [Brassica napus]
MCCCGGTRRSWCVGVTVGTEVNRGLMFLQDLACRGSLKQFLMAAIGLWLAAMIGSCCNFLTVLYIGFVGAGGVFVCIFLWRIMFGIASTFVGLSEGMAKYGFLVLSSAIVAFAGVEATPLVGHVLVQYWRCDFERKTKDEGDEDDSGFREKESRYSHRGRISSVAFVTEKSPESFVDDQFPWLSSKKNLGGVARRRISVAMSIGESLWLSSTEEIGGSPLQTNSSAGAKLNRKLFPHMASKNHRD